jgi:hypothetical protein
VAKVHKGYKAIERDRMINKYGIVGGMKIGMGN